MKVLLIEHRECLKNDMVHVLRGQGHAVDATHDGRIGLGLALIGDHDAMLLNSTTPGVADTPALRTLRQLRDMPVLVLTDAETLEGHPRDLDDTADDFILHPYPSDELLSRLQSLPRRASAKTVSVGNLRIDIRRRRLWSDGRHVPLTPAEFDVVQSLARLPGVVVPRRQLNTRLGDESGQSLYVHIHNLRRKLGRDVIRTMSGLGYWIDR